MSLFSQTLGPLTKHMSGEEALFYPKLEANSDTKVLALKLTKHTTLEKTWWER